MHHPDHAIALKTMIDSRFDETIDLQDLAGNLYVRPDYLRHIFKQRIGLSPSQYRQGLRKKAPVSGNP